jgi:peroxiredoxin (alkyl hydroperoxide reductase subunit C)
MNVTTITAETTGFSSERIRRDGPAPDFIAEALVQGRQAQVRLSEFGRMWTVLFFYASDFTFV